MAGRTIPTFVTIGWGQQTRAMTGDKSAWFFVLNHLPCTNVPETPTKESPVFSPDQV